jgi:uncharacterized membrane protein
VFVVVVVVVVVVYFVIDAVRKLSDTHSHIKRAVLTNFKVFARTLEITRDPTEG